MLSYKVDSLEALDSTLQMFGHNGGTSDIGIIIYGQPIKLHIII